MCERGRFGRFVGVRSGLAKVFSEIGKTNNKKKKNQNIWEVCGH